MTISQLENAFQKTIHPDLKNKLFISVEDYQIDTDEGIIVFLDENFDERWIGRGGSVSWAPRSPVLTPLDFFL